MATTTDLTTGTKLPAKGYAVAAAFVKVIDFSVNNGGAADIFKAVALPAKSLVALTVDVDTGEGATCTIDAVTTEDTPQTFLDDASIETATTLVGDGADGDASLIWLHILSACTLNIVTNTAATDAAKITLRVFVFDSKKGE